MSIAIELLNSELEILDQKREELRSAINIITGETRQGPTQVVRERRPKSDKIERQLNRIVDVLAASKKKLTGTEIGTRAGVGRNNIWARMRHLVREGRVAKDQDLRYSLIDNTANMNGFPGGKS